MRIFDCHSHWATQKGYIFRTEHEMAQQAKVWGTTATYMTEDEMAHALTPFGQNGNRFTGRHDGTGLGLPLAKAMLELHGGTLTLTSAPDMGTTVTMVLPADRTSFHGKKAA